MGTDYQHIRLDVSRGIGIVLLNRPQVHNAFHGEMISEITDCFRKINTMDHIRVVLLKGEGKSFCAGADLNWMRDVASYGFDQNYEEGLGISDCMYAIYSCNKPTIAQVHGAAYGGATGLLAACDMAYADENTTFSLSEVNIGLIPATIGPYILKRVGEFNARELMLTGARIKGTYAEKKGLITAAVPADQLESTVQRQIDLLLTSGPDAMRACKELIYGITNTWSLDQAKIETARMIAERRVSSEGQEGMASFLEKRKANWIEESK